MPRILEVSQAWNLNAGHCFLSSTWGDDRSFALSTLLDALVSFGGFEVSCQLQWRILKKDEKGMCWDYLAWSFFYLHEHWHALTSWQDLTMHVTHPQLRVAEIKSKKYGHICIIYAYFIFNSCSSVLLHVSYGWQLATGCICPEVLGAVFSGWSRQAQVASTRRLRVNVQQAPFLSDPIPSISIYIPGRQSLVWSRLERCHRFHQMCWSGSSTRIHSLLIPIQKRDVAVVSAGNWFFVRSWFRPSCWQRPLLLWSQSMV